MRRALLSLSLLTALLSCSHPAATQPPATVAAVSAAPALPTAPTEAAPALRLPDDARPVAYRLALEARADQPGYSGTVEIDVALAKARQTFWLHAEKELTASKVLIRSGKVAHPAALLAPDANGLRALVTDAPLSGQVTLEIAFQSAYDHRNEGLYQVNFDGRPYLFTQLESIYARRMFPCFDEPAFKAPLTLTVTTNERDTVVANTPIESEEINGVTRIVVFKPTAPLPTYLYAMAIGTFDVVDAPAVPVNSLRPVPLPLRGIAPHGQGAQLAMALAEAPKHVDALEQYFGLPFPFPKLDLVAVPDFASGAMENAGLITFRSQLLLLDPKSASLRRVKLMSMVSAHEIAHQWFGDLVTTSWWNDSWLNEAFAEWMEMRIAATVHPDWRMGVELVGNSNAIMATDTLASGRSIRQPIVTSGDILNAFDGITYTKGAAVIDMFEHDLGKEVFQRGIHDYLVAHESRNSTMDDLVGALSKAAGRDVATPFKTFLDQPGVPLVRFAAPNCAASGNSVAMTQSRFVLQGSTAPTDFKWQVPVCVRYDRDGRPDVACTLLTDTQGTLALPGKKCPAWLQPNADSRGYYRWTLPAKELTSLSKASAPFSDPDRMSVVNTLAAGYTAGVVPAADALRALEPFVKDPVPEVGLVFGEVAQDIYLTSADAKLREAVQLKLRALYGPQQKAMGLDFPRGEPDAATTRRIALINLVAFIAEDPALLKALATKGRAYLGVDSDRKVHPEAVAPEIASSCGVAAVRLDEALVPGLIERAQAETDEAARRNLRASLNGAKTAAGAAQVRAMAYDKRTRVNETILPYGAQLSDQKTRDAAWADLNQNLDALAARQGEKTANRLPMLASSFCDEGHAKGLEDLFAARVSKTVGLDRQLHQSAERIRLCAAKLAVQEPSARAYFLKQ